jgi:hypothetical protein
MEEFEEAAMDFSWADNGSHLCYEAAGGSWCGLKDDCSQKGMWLPIFNEQTWPKWFRTGLYLFALLYRYRDGHFYFIAHLFYWK